MIGAGLSDEALDATATSVGRAIGARGGILVCGGLGGVMEAACRGAKEAGGLTLAFLPRLDRSEANEAVDIALPTGMGEMRNMLIVRACDAVVAVGGEYGTLSEISFALKVGVPVVGIGTWELAKAGRIVDAFEQIDDPEAAVARAFELAKAR